MERAIRKILEKTESIEDNIPHFPKKGYEPVKISKAHFYKIKQKYSDRKIAFIDGGNQEIMGAPDFSLQFIRIYACIYQNNKRTGRRLYESYALITTEKNNEELAYSVMLFPKKNQQEEKKFIFDIYDDTLKVGDRKVDIRMIGDVTRKFLEIIASKDLCGTIRDGIILMDRNLEATTTGEDKLLEGLYDAAKKNGVTVSGPAKTTSLLTTSGNSVPAILQDISPPGAWHYHPLAKISSPKHKADLFLVKLHERSKYLFRLEVCKNQDYSIGDILSLISNNSKDPVFLGYPYGLVEADRYARVQNKEIELLKTQAFVKLGKDFERIRTHLSAKNAHEDRKSTRLNSSHTDISRMPSSA